jgi:hypothetical protein
MAMLKARDCSRSWFDSRSTSYGFSVSASGHELHYAVYLHPAYLSLRSSRSESPSFALGLEIGQRARRVQSGLIGTIRRLGGKGAGDVKSTAAVERRGGGVLL